MIIRFLTSILIDGVKKLRVFSGKVFFFFLKTAFDFNAKEFNHVRFHMDSIVIVNQVGHSIRRILRRPKIKYVKLLRRLGFSALIQVYNKMIESDLKC